MAENLKKILNIDGTDYNINAVYSDEAGRVTNPLIVKRSGESAFNFDGSVAGQTIDYVPTTGGTFSGKVYIDHANVEDEDLGGVADDELLNYDQIKHLVCDLTQHPLYSWEGNKLNNLKNVHSGLSGLNVVVGTADEFKAFKRLMCVPDISSTNEATRYYGLRVSSSDPWTEGSVDYITRTNSTYTDVYLPSYGYYGELSTDEIDLSTGVPITAIREKAFESNKTIESVMIPESITTINSYAFRYCSALKSIKLPSKLERITTEAFNGCTSLKSIIIGKNVKKISREAFKSCSNLRTVYYEGTEDDWLAFNSVDTVTLADDTKQISNTGNTALTDVYTKSKAGEDGYNFVFNYIYTTEFIDLPCLYICTDLGTDDLNIDNVNKMFLKMPNSGLFVELSRGATYLESTLTSSKESYTYEGLAEIIAKINKRLEAIGDTTLKIADSQVVNATIFDTSHALIPDDDFDIESVPTVQSLDARLDSIEAELGIQNEDYTDTRLDAIEDGETRVVKEARKVSNGLTINVEDDTFVYDGSSAEEVTIKTTYTNETPIVKAIGSIVVGQTFKDVPVQEMLTMILYPFIDIEVSWENLSSSQAVASPDTHKYYVHGIPTISRITFNVDKKSVTDVTFVLWDTTNNTEIATLDGSEVQNKQLIFEDLRLTVNTTRTIALKYTYYHREHGRTVTKTCTVGTFTIVFQDPSTPSISHTVKANSASGSKTSYYCGETAEITGITTSVTSLNSASATGGITKLELLKEGTVISSLTPTSGSDANLGGTMTFTMQNGSETLTSASTDTITYKIRAYYNTRTGTSTSLSQTYKDSSDLNITFTYVDPTISWKSWTGSTYSKLSPQYISNPKCTFKKNSGKITSVKLLEGSTELKTNTVSGYNGDAYNATAVDSTFTYTSGMFCTKKTYYAKAYNGSTEVASASATVDFYAPWCYGFVDADTTFASVDRTTLAGLPDANKKSSEQTSINLSAPGSLKKFIYAVPNGTFKSAKDSSNEENFGLFEKNASGGTTKAITWEDGTTTTYQILILKNPSAAAVNLKFSK